MIIPMKICHVKWKWPRIEHVEIDNWWFAVFNTIKKKWLAFVTINIPYQHNLVGALYLNMLENLEINEQDYLSVTVKSKHTANKYTKTRCQRWLKGYFVKTCHVCIIWETDI